MIYPANQLLKISMYWSSSVGIWPIIFMDNKKLKRIYVIYSTVLYFYNLEYTLRAYFKLMSLLGEPKLNVPEILGNLCITLIYTVAILRLKALNTKAVKQLFLNIIQEEKNILNNTDANVKDIYLESVKKNKFYNILFLFNGWAVTILYFIHPVISELPTEVVDNQTVAIKSLPLSTWWPFDIRKHYLLAYIWNVFDGTLGSSYVINSDILTFSLIVFALGQLKILSYKIRNFSGRQGNKNMDFKNFIKQHQKIIRYIDTFNEAMKNVMLFDFLQCSVQMATIVLQLLVMENTFINLVFVGEFIITMIIRLVIYYYNANEIINTSEKIAMDIWTSKWYDEPIETKKIMLIVIIRSQKPLKLLIGPFAVMSLQTFITILKATYSYMMLFINTSG